MKKTNEIFKTSACLTNKQIENYNKGQVSATELRSTELHLADCQICSDTLAGYMLLKDKTALTKIISALDKKILAKTSTKIIPLVAAPKTFRIKRILSIAASIALLVTLGWLGKTYISGTSPTNFAMAEEGIFKKAKDNFKTIKQNPAPPPVVAEKTNEQKLADNTIAKPIKENTKTALKENIKAEKEELEEEEIITEDENDVSNELITTGLKPINEISEITDTDDAELEDVISTEMSDEVALPTTVSITPNKDQNLSALNDVKRQEKKKKLKDYFNKRRNKNIKNEDTEMAKFAGTTRHLKAAKTATFADGETAYKSKKYSKAKNIFTNLYKNSPESKTLYFIGMTVYKQGKFDEALLTFEQLIHFNNNYSDKAKLMKSLIFLKQGKTQEHTALLQELQKSGISLSDTLKY